MATVVSSWYYCFMEKQFFIILGRSGSGKGTQAALLKDFLEQTYKHPVLHSTTGGNFRNFIASDSYVAHLARNVNESGGLQPEFLAVWNWSDIFIHTLKGDETIILDGAPRKPFEVNVLHSAISFLGYKNPIVIYLDTSESVSREHLLGRGREDDKGEAQVNRRMSWFEVEVLPVVDAYKNDPRYTMIHINGNQTIEEVNRELFEKLKPPLP
jgi:adenylate kinase family enzyme